MPKPQLTEAQKAWIKELREGGHSQTTRNLQDEEGYCCLGVGCVAFEKVLGMELPRFRLGYYNRAVLNDEFTKVRKWLGLNSSTGQLIKQRNYAFESLADFNDNGGLSFSQIADLIEADPAAFFIQEGESTND